MGAVEVWKIERNGINTTVEVEPYGPRKKNKAVLQRAFEMVQNVPYKVSLRWVFYKLWQENYFSQSYKYGGEWKTHDKVGAYNSFESACKEARTRFYNGWRPWTLIDKTRGALHYGFGGKDPEDWYQGLIEGATCKIDKHQAQDYYIEVWFEARAMIDQFRYYTNYVTLRPMAGYSSVTFLWDTAEDLMRAYQRYQKPVKILYFGDLDEHGLEIYESAADRMREWCGGIDYEMIRCGLKKEQIKKYGVEENWEKEGFQWEALSDRGANKIITEALRPYSGVANISQIEALEKAATEKAREALRGVKIDFDE